MSSDFPNIASEAGQHMHALASQLYPICRSITGDGVRQTLKILQQHIPLAIHEVPSGTQVFDWTVPKEWSIREAWIKDPSGKKIVDFGTCNLHVVNYSTPIRARMPLAELRPHLFSLPEHPQWVPYRTSYYTETWGFCLRDEQLRSLPEGEYEICIDSTLADGSLSYGEVLLKGDSAQEILISCHVCHPSLANDNLSGICVATWLAKALAEMPRRFSWRFLFIPGTIGSITWLSRHADAADFVRAGMVLSCVGDAGGFTYKKSRRGDTLIDRAAVHVLEYLDTPYAVRDFIPYGYDERQYCSPGFDLPVGALMRTPNGCYPQYHTSADNLEFLKAQSLRQSLEACLLIAEVLEHDRRFRNRKPHCEPQLGKRGLYKAVGGAPDPGRAQMAMLWVLNLSDGAHSLLDIARRANMPFALIRQAAEILRQHDLLEEISTQAKFTMGQESPY